MQAALYRRNQFVITGPTDIVADAGSHGGDGEIFGALRGKQNYRDIPILAAQETDQLNGIENMGSHLTDHGESWPGVFEMTENRRAVVGFNNLIASIL